MTRPDLSFDVNFISSQIKTASSKTVKDLNKIIAKAKANTSVLTFKPLGSISNLRLKVFTDASYSNQEDQTRSTAGKVLVMEDSISGKQNLISWKTKKISRICRYVKAAETRALEEGLDDAINTSRVVMEVYKGEINLRKPAQIPVHAYVDSKSLWESLHSTRQCEEKLLRNSVAGMKQLMQLGEVSEVNWVPTEKQLADCMTKKGKRGTELLDIAGGSKF